MWKLGFLLMLHVVSSLVYDPNRDCPVTAIHECHCEPHNIDCEDKGLTDTHFPNFARRAWHFTFIKLGKNQFTSIRGNAFDNINVTDIYLNDNQISYIADEAFNQLKGQIRSLDLRNNHLLRLPDAIASLSKLDLLDVSGNPISSLNFTNTTMRAIGDTIHEFRFGDPSLVAWPSSIHHFQQLHILKFFDGRMDRIPITSFYGFEWTLQKLWIQNTSLISVPIALQDLKSTVELHFDNNVNVGDAGILIPAFAGLTKKLTTLTLENNSLSTFPNVLITLNVLHNLSLARNDLQFVSDEAVEVVGSNLTTLNLQDCNLDRIPGALSKIQGVTNLDFSYNKITTIEKNDLERLGLLRSLNVSHNPLQYISKSTFHDLKQLRELVLEDTYLYIVPEALKNMPMITELKLKGPNPMIECNCDLSWLYCYMKHNNTRLRIEGQCETINLDIQTYANRSIPDQCPTQC